MTDAPLLWDSMPWILAMGFFMFCLGLGLGLVAGFWWGRTLTIGDTCAIQDLCDRINDAEAEIERLREKAKYDLSID